MPSPFDPSIRSAADLLTGQGQRGETAPDLHWRMGPVTAVDTVTGTATVTIGGTNVPGIHWLVGHQPAVNDLAMVAVSGTDTLILGRASTGADPETPSIGAKVITPTGAGAVNSLTGAFPSGTDSAIIWSVEVHDDGNMWTSGSPTRLTVPAGAGGWWLVGGRCHYGGNTFTAAAGATFRFATTIKMSGNIKGRAQPAVTAANNANGHIWQTTDMLYAAAGDYFELFGFQDTGSAMNLFNTLGEGSNSLWAYRLGP